MNNLVKKEEIIKCNYQNLFMCCSNCEKTSCKLVVDGFCYVDLADNGICLECYKILNEKKLAKKFRVE
jgi:hypothetical protein